MGASWIVALVVIAVMVVIGIALRSSGAEAPAARDKIRQGALVLDVRTPAEYASGHYDGATNIPLGELKDRLAAIGDKQRSIVVYCASGVRSAAAARILRAAGFHDVTNAGGLSNLD